MGVRNLIGHLEKLGFNTSGLIPDLSLALGTLATPFSLNDVNTQQQASLDDLRGEIGTLMLFICNHCPYVKHIEHGLVKLYQDYQGRGFGIVAISSNDAETYPQDGPAAMAAKGFPFPYLFDETQNIARAYQVACTPDCYLFDRDLRLVYRGQFDDSRPGSSRPVSGTDVRGALDALVAGKAVSDQQTASIGCSIKWREA